MTYTIVIIFKKLKADYINYITKLKIKNLK